MKALVAFFVVGFLEQNIGANLCFFKHAVFIYSRCGNVYVNASDSAIFMLDGIDGVHAFQDVFNRIMFRIFACFNGETFVSHVLQGDHFSANFILG